MPKTISVCIPTYEYSGKGVAFLKTLFKSIRAQKFKDYEVIISDHSLNDDIRILCDRQKKFDVRYFRNNHKRGSIAANTNFAIENSSGKIVKIMYQDDFFISKDALEKIVNFFHQHDIKWMFHGFAHAKNKWRITRPMVPEWTTNLLIGDNLLGSPSCLAFLNSAGLYMDDHLKLLVDTELYYRMQLTHGMPAILPDILIANREHKRRTSSSTVDYNFEVKTDERCWKVDKMEFDYVLEKHKETFAFRQD